MLAGIQAEKPAKAARKRRLLIFQDFADRCHALSAFQRRNITDW